MIKFSEHYRRPADQLGQSDGASGEYAAGVSRRQFLQILGRSGAVLAGGMMLGGAAGCSSAPERAHTIEGHQPSQAPAGPTYTERTPEQWRTDARLADDRTRGYSRSLLSHVRQSFNEPLYLSKGLQASTNEWSLANHGSRPMDITWNEGYLTLTANGQRSSKSGASGRLQYTATYAVPDFDTPRRYLADMLASSATELSAVSYVNGADYGGIHVFHNGEGEAGPLVVVDNVSATVEDVRQRVMMAANGIDAAAGALGL